jgi:16S rRNA (guanine527-N7)-methyltransferase
MQSELDRFELAVKANMSVYEVELTAETLALLRTYYSLLIRWNERLHLVAPCSPEEFATRHVLESLMLLKHLPSQAKIADIGPGSVPDRASGFECDDDRIVAEKSGVFA